MQKFRVLKLFLLDRSIFSRRIENDPSAISVVLYSGNNFIFSFTPIDQIGGSRNNVAVAASNRTKFTDPKSHRYDIIALRTEEHCLMNMYMCVRVRVCVCVYTTVINEKHTQNEQNVKSEKKRMFPIEASHTLKYI